QARYRTRKGYTGVNCLGVVNLSLQFIYSLAGWEGSAHDSRVLRDALSRPDGLRVPQGNYYLVDVGYMNANSFLAPYQGQRYHLQEWGTTMAKTGGTSTRDYKSWSKQEEALLVTCMRELVDERHVEKGNFRLSHLRALDRMMHTRLEGCQLLAEPHIKSKV
ncbi:hypothetical protein LINPERPRIM_LOCUS20842, partial [Linum perenne]